MGIKGGLRAMERRKNMDARDVALYGLLIALAFVLSYVESLIPISLGGARRQAGGWPIWR